MLLSNSCPSGFLYHLRSHKTEDQEECWQLHLLAQWCFLQMPFHIWMGRWTMEAASPMHSPPRLNAVISSHAKSTEWPIDAYNYSMETGYLPKYIFTCLHWNFVQCPLYPKTVNLDGGRKDGKYKGKSVPMSFGQQKMVRMLLEWVQHRDHMPYSVLTQMLKQSHPYLMLQPTMCRIWGYTSEGSDWLSAPRSYPLLWPG